MEFSDDFGDFQTANNGTTSLSDNKSDMMNFGENIFESDRVRFDEFRSRFEMQLVTYYFLEKSSTTTTASSDNSTSVTQIRSQEDIVNDSRIWNKLTGSFNMKPPLNFSKSLTFQRFYPSLKLDNQDDDDVDGSRKKNHHCDLPANARKRDASGDEIDIANDLDMHSLIIGSSFESSPVHNNKQRDVVDADQVIQEIERMMDSNQSTPVKTTARMAKQTKDPLLSLDAATLLDAALKTWHAENDQATSVFVSPLDGDQDDDDDDDEQYHSLPVDLNHHQDGGIDAQVLALKASNMMLNSRIINSEDTAVLTNNGLDGNESQRKKSKPEQKELSEKLSQLSIVQLNELYMELEQIIQIRSEILIQELALRDELEYEKEQKNSFISLLLSVQNKRRHYMSPAAKTRASGHHRPMGRRNSNDGAITSKSTGREVRRNHSTAGQTTTSHRFGIVPTFDHLTSIGSSIKSSLLPSSLTAKPTPVYLTTVIPYTSSMIPIDTPTLQILIKLLKALNEDSSEVPALLTDYILKVICP